VAGKDIRLVKSLAPDLRPIHADQTQLEQVLVNLVVNARDAMPEGGTLTIQTANMVLDDGFGAEHPGNQPEAHAVLTVSDTGMGMNAEVKARIFEPYFTTKAHGKGTGLGLATVMGIVKQSGGHIVVDSSPGQGATFRVFLPSTNGSSPPAEPGHPVVFDKAIAGQPILLVENV
jgi:two-component system cell cycle sensor histidine kinase/response regulator CckA